MLSRSRTIALLFLALGIALAVAGAALPKVLTESKPVPLDLSSSTLALEDPAATIGPNYQGMDKDKPVKAPVLRQFNMTLGQPATDEEASARVGVATHRKDVKDDLQSLLDAQVFSYRVDRFSGEAMGATAKVADTPVMPSSDVAMEGFWAKFPENTEKGSYDYFDVTLRQALPAKFDREETRTTDAGHDVPVYVFRQEIEAASVKENYEGIRNEITDRETGEKAQLFHEGWREIAVEPNSGMIVGVEEDVTDAYRVDGREVQTLLEFHGRTSENNNRKMLQQAMEIGNERELKTWRVALAVIGVIVAAVSLVVVVRPSRAKRKNKGEPRASE